jgi:hypothetical protein
MRILEEFGMVCPRCTLLRADAVVICHQCGYRFTTAIQQYGALALGDARLKIGAITGLLLFGCLFAAVLAPSAAAGALSIGAYAGIVSIANSWLAVCTTAEGERAAGMRGTVFSAALLYSLSSELARLHGADRIAFPGIAGMQFSMMVPSAAVTEMIAAVLIVMDPLLAHPVIRWLGEGVQRTE